MTVTQVGPQERATADSPSPPGCRTTQGRSRARRRARTVSKEQETEAIIVLKYGPRLREESPPVTEAPRPRAVRARTTRPPARHGATVEKGRDATSEPEPHDSATPATAACQPSPDPPRPATPPTGKPTSEAMILFTPETEGDEENRKRARTMSAETTTVTTAEVIALRYGKQMKIDTSRQEDAAEVEVSPQTKEPESPRVTQVRAAAGNQQTSSKKGKVPAKVEGNRAEPLPEPSPPTTPTTLESDLTLTGLIHYSKRIGSMTIQVICREKRSLLRRNHPDVSANQGENREMFTAKSKLINAAFDRLTGFSEAYATYVAEWNVWDASQPKRKRRC